MKSKSHRKFATKLRKIANLLTAAGTKGSPWGLGSELAHAIGEKYGLTPKESPSAMEIDKDKNYTGRLFTLEDDFGKILVVEQQSPKFGDPELYVLSVNIQKNDYNKLLDGKEDERNQIQTELEELWNRFIGAKVPAEVSSEVSQRGSGFKLRIWPKSE